MFSVILLCTLMMLHYIQLSTASFLNGGSRKRSRRNSILSRIIKDCSIYDDDEIPGEKQRRNPKWRFKRIDMNEHFEMCEHTNTFVRHYHMTRPSFHALVDILDISIDATKSMNSTSGNAPITSTMVVTVGLRYMGGEEPKSLADVFGMSIESTNRVINLFLKAVDSSKHPHLSIDLLPETEIDIKLMAKEWQMRSRAYNIYYGMLGAIDGMLCTTERPSDVPHPSAYFSGHYQRYGINVQAMCDANLRFTYLSIAGPGGKNDARVFRRLLRLRRWLSNLKAGYFIAGDNAYPLLKNLLIPFSGSNARIEKNDSYNFHLSQLRIRIEMTFGRLTCKWRIFRKNLLDANGFIKNSRIIRVGAMLHNFVINADQLNFLNVDDTNHVAICIEPLLNGPEGNVGYLPIPPEEEEEVDFERRDRIVQELYSREMFRPKYNQDRNNI